MPVRMFLSSAEYLLGHLYVCAGYIPDEGSGRKSKLLIKELDLVLRNKYSASCYSLNVMEEGSQWIHSSRLNGARDDHRMIAFNDNLYVFGGWRDGGAHGSTEKYTPDKLN